MPKPDAMLLDIVPAPLRADLCRLWRISPWFRMLLHDISEDEARLLLKAREYAQLPDRSEMWVPASDCRHDLAASMQHLRRCKRHALRHFIWWEMGVHGDIARSWHAIADFAEGLLDEALLMAKALIAPRYGSLKDGHFCVVGLGKLGGYELNLGSDIDPLFLWQGEGKSAGGRQAVVASEYYRHLSKMLVRLFSEHTAEGQVWPVDMRLRPGGDSAAIALSLDATLNHYLEYGQTWERAMLIKARPVAGSMQLGDAFMTGIAPFIYRRYLDYTTVAALADMKRRIDLQAGEMTIACGFDVKRGRGAIREIEFITQSQQLLYGGRNMAIRAEGTIEALHCLQKFDLLPADDVQLLQEAYRFWRTIEHAVQARVGEHTHRLPKYYAEYLSEATGIQAIDRTMREYALAVEALFGKWVQPLRDDDELVDWLAGKHAAIAALPDSQKERMRAALADIDKSLARGLLPERSRGQVQRILAVAMPKWLDDANGVDAVESFAGLIHAIAGRATWVDLLATHRGVLAWLIGVLSASRYLAGHIVRDPSWLEWPLLHERGDGDLASILASLSSIRISADVEQVLADLGRGVDRARVLSALAVDAHLADAMQIGGWLADVADEATALVLRLCLYEMKLPDDFPFVALAMGKHGSREMGLVSDLDMVFLLVDDDPARLYQGRSMREHAQRLGRRMIHYLSGMPPFGAGYTFDARLRPSGCSGVLVTTLKGFYHYQMHEAQTWEHQALCRARPVAGMDEAKARVEAVIGSVLQRPRKVETLASDVLSMRNKMLVHLASRSDWVMNLKHDAGGLVDIEFLAQFARLHFLIPQRRTVDILTSLPEDAPQIWLQRGGWLAARYRDYRQMENTLRVELWRSIGQLPLDPAAPEWETMHRHAAIDTPQQLRDVMQRVHDDFHALLAVFRTAD